MVGVCSTYGERRFANKVLVGRLEVNRPLGRPRSRWKENIKLKLQEGGCGIWTGSIWLRKGTGGGQLCMR